MQDIIDWIHDYLALDEGSSTEFIYRHTESQSAGKLPLVYVPFDAAKVSHWRDRALILSFAEAAGTGRVLDFGPGDGWPALPLSQMVESVVGVESCERRAAVCRQNAERMGRENAEFVVVEPASPLPFDEGSFDAVTAASSVEQTPDPRATLEELFRVLRPGGALMLHYEALERYRGDEEQTLWPIRGLEEGESRLIVIDRDLEAETAEHYGLVFRVPFAQMCAFVGGGLTADDMTNLLHLLKDGMHWTTRHPSCATWRKWMQEIGFRESRPTARPAPRAEALFERLPEEERPTELEAVDELLRPTVRRALEDPPVMEPEEAPILAVK